MKQEKVSYKDSYLNQGICEYISKVVIENVDSLLPAKLDNYNVTADLFSWFAEPESMVEFAYMT